MFLNDIERNVKETVDNVNGPKKVYTTLKCVVVKIDLKTGERIHTNFNGRSKTHTITIQLGDTYEEMKQKMLESLAKFQKEGSGWRLHSVEGLYISIVKFDLLNGAGYSILPPFIAKKKAIINMKNEKCEEGKRISNETNEESRQCKCKKCEEAKMCFKWAVTRALNPTNSKPERITKELREQAEKLNWNDIPFPTKVKDIRVWEKNNKNKININVFGYDEETKTVNSIKLCDGCTSIVTDEDESQKNNFISLFLHDDNHYCVVKNLSRLVSSQYYTHKESKHFGLNCTN